jgi:hypothetical protein
LLPSSETRRQRCRERDFRVYGKAVTEGFDFVCAVTREGEMELELIQPIMGPNIYRRFLEEHGEGIHHFKEIVSDPEIPRVIESFRRRGIAVVYEVGNGGRIGPPQRRYPEEERG